MRTLPHKREPLSTPARVYLNLTQRCNYSCPYCYSANSILAKDDLSTDELRKLFAELDAMNTFLLVLCGGEPFIRSDVGEILAMLPQHRFATRINTNGYFIDEAMVDRIKTSRMHLVNVSFDGPKKVYEEMSGVKGSWDRVTNAIRLMVAAGIKVDMELVLTSRTIDHVHETLEIARSLDVNGLKILPLTKVGKGDSSDLSIDYDMWKDFYLDLTSRKLEGKLAFNNVRIGPLDCNRCSWFMYYPLPEVHREEWLKSVWGVDLTKAAAPEGGLHCRGGIEWCAIMSNGDVYGCDQMNAISELRAGSLRQKTLQEIWSGSSVFNHFRSLTKKDLEGPCGKCKNEFCSGSNFGEAHQMTGSILGSNEGCIKARGLIK